MRSTDATTEIQVKPGHCASHGPVTATRAVPRLRFPSLIYDLGRLLASRRAFRCPTCGVAVTVA